MDIEPGTVVVVGGWEAMHVVGNSDRNELVWVVRTHTHTRGVRVVHYEII